MKKKIIIVGVIVLVVAIVIGYLLMSKNTKEIDDGLTTITIDINPSIEIKVNDALIVSEVNSLNQDGKDLISDTLKGNNLEYAFKYIVNKAFEYNYITEEVPTVIIGMENENTHVVGLLRNAFLSKDKAVLIIVPNITKDAEKVAEKNNISPAKAAYLLEVTKNNNKLKIEDIKDKSVAEINEMHTTGYYCDKGWVLNGNLCEKKIREEKPKEGTTCPNGYELINDNCFKSEEPQREIYCTDGKTLKNNLCVGETSTNAKGKCASGTFNESTMRCDVYTYNSAGEQKCRGDNPKISKKGTCSYPKPTINGGCESGDTLVGEWCYNLVDGGDEYPTITCPSGSVVANGANGRGCYTKTAATPTYYCEDGATLRGTKCVSSKDSTPEVKLSCDKDHTLYEDRVCIDYNKFTDQTDGLYCEENARLVNKTCFVYETKEANKN